jgi:hypothetical protein
MAARGRTGAARARTYHAGPTCAYRPLHPARNRTVGAFDATGRAASLHGLDECSGREQCHYAEWHRDKKAAAVNAQSKEGGRDQEDRSAA